MCDQCCRHFTTKRGLRLHGLSKHGKGKIPYKCNICGKAYTSITSYRGHVDKHAGIKHKCTRCGSKFGHAFSLKRHSKDCGKKSEVIKTFKCNECGRNMKDQQTLNDHTEALQQQRMPHRCRNCGKCFKWRSSRSYHEGRCISKSSGVRKETSLSVQERWHTPRK